MFEALLRGLLLSLSLCLDLGVVNIALIRTTLNVGSRPALVMALGSAVGDLCYALVSTTALALLLHYRGVRLALWLAGSLALLWLTFSMLRESYRHRSLSTARSGPAAPPGADAPATAAGPPAVLATSLPAYFLRGIALALASPSGILWFAAIGGSVIAATTRDRSRLLPFLCGFALGGLLWSIALTVAVSRGRRFVSERRQQQLALLAAGLFAWFAAQVLWSGWREFVR